CMNMKIMSIESPLFNAAPRSQKTLQAKSQMNIPPKSLMMKTSMYLLQRIDPRLAKEKDGAEDNFLTKVLISKQTTTESIKTETNAIKESFNLKTDDKLEELPKKILDTNEVSEAKQAPSQKT
ncbi:MAG: hypothetical protein K2N45_01150, partial [Helicobacter japonicus]|nr:hypothetical protein [Helicobacter japonicus]